MSFSVDISEGWYDFVDGKLTKTDLVIVKKDEVEVDYIVAKKSVTIDDIVIDKDGVRLCDNDDVCKELEVVVECVSDVTVAEPKFLFLTVADMVGKLSEEVVEYDVGGVGVDKGFYLLDSNAGSVVMYNSISDSVTSLEIYEHAILNYFVNGIDHTVVSSLRSGFKTELYVPAFDDDIIVPFYVLFETEGLKMFDKLSNAVGVIEVFNSSIVKPDKMLLKDPVIVIDWFAFEHCNDVVVRALAYIVNVFVNKVDRRYDYIHISVMKKYEEGLFSEI